MTFEKDHEQIGGDGRELVFCRLLSLAPEEEAVQLWGAHFFGDGNAAWSFHLAQVLRTRQDCRYNVSDRCLHLNHDDSQI